VFVVSQYLYTDYTAGMLFNCPLCCWLMAGKASGRSDQSGQVWLGHWWSAWVAW